ncbi:MAG: hypothetical protein ACR2OV_02465 [Hyphomicrobiaceae bacterium]
MAGIVEEQHIQTCDSKPAFNVFNSNSFRRPDVEYDTSRTAQGFERQRLEGYE